MTFLVSQLLLRLPSHCFPMSLPLLVRGRHGGRLPLRLSRVEW
jgi:hypothetical protein